MTVILACKHIVIVISFSYNAKLFILAKTLFSLFDNYACFIAVDRSRYFAVTSDGAFLKCIMQTKPAYMHVTYATSLLLVRLRLQNVYDENTIL